VKLSVHVTEQRNFLHFTFSYKNGIDRIKAKGWNVKIGKVIGTKDVLPFTIQLYFALDLVREKRKDKKRFGPPTIDNPNKMKLFGEKNGNNQKRKKEKEEYPKNGKAIIGMQPSYEFHWLMKFRQLAA
jgi:hypothetical protein